jgi:hypothetical protein
MNMAVATAYHRARDYDGVVRYLWWIVAAAVACAQTQPKEKAGDYETSGRAGPVAIGAEYMVHSFSDQGKTFLAPDYLVVEVALYPPKGVEIEASPSDFTLRVDGKRIPTAAVHQVLWSLQRGGWDRQSGAVATIGAGDSNVILGAPRRPTTPYPQGPGSQGPPPPPRAPEPDYRGNVPREEVTAEDVLKQTAFPAGNFAGPVSGFVYFPYKAKASRIRSVELIYRDTVLKLK